MAIRLLGAMMARNCYTDNEGRFHIVDPIDSLELPSDKRAAFLASGKNKIVAPVPEMCIVLQLWGGSPGQKVKITGALGTEKGAGVVLTKEITFSSEGGFRLTLNIAGELGFERSAVNELRFLADGEPLGVIPLPVRWDDETPI